MKNLDSDDVGIDLQASAVPQQGPQRKLMGIKKVTEGARTLFVAVGALAAITGVKINNDGHNCSGCSVCVPPPIARKSKDDEDEEDDRDDNEDDKD